MTEGVSNGSMKGSKNEQEVIKNAVTSDQAEPEEVGQQYSENPAQPATQEYTGMEQSVMSPASYEETSQPSPPAPEEYQGYEQPSETQTAGQQDYNYQDQYSGYQPVSISPDTMNEVAEQVVAEKLGPIATGMEKLLDQKATFEAQIQYLDDRLKRIEKIIDRLQLSLLQKVGEYVTNVDDIKREMIETQKSFKSMWDQREQQRERKAPSKSQF